MKSKAILFLSLINITVMSAFISFDKQNDLTANTKELPSWSVTVRGDGGYGILPDADVYIEQGGTRLFGSPHSTDQYGFTWFGNGGSAFPNGTYTVRASKTGYSDGTTTVVIANGVPVYPVTYVTIGPPY